MQQTISLIAGMTKVFKSQELQHKQKDICKCQKLNNEYLNQNKEYIQELANKTFKENDKENEDQNMLKLQRQKDPNSTKYY